METLTPKRKELLSFITDFIRERGYAPSVRDVARGCHISSSSVAQYHLNVLEREGYIHRDREVSRSIGLIGEYSGVVRVPLLGTIAAGKPVPVPSEEAWNATVQESLDIPQVMAGRRNKLFALRVKGTSMVDALINDGDIVLMQSVNNAEDGDMVAVWLKDEQEVTLKRIYREPERVCLKPANSLMTPIYTTPDNIEIQGQVICVLRKL
jgi:repressor LexA